jgi:hypothetical protein
LIAATTSSLTMVPTPPIRRAIEKYDIAVEQQDRIMARPIMGRAT